MSDGHRRNYTTLTDVTKGSKGIILESKTFRDGAIYLYKRADYRKPTWLCRIKVPNGNGYVNPQHWHRR